MQFDISRDFLDGMHLQQPGQLRDGKREIRAGGQLQFLPSSPDGTMHTAIVAFALSLGETEKPFAQGGWRFLFTTDQKFDPKSDSENPFFRQLLALGAGKIMAQLNNLCMHANLPLIPFMPEQMVARPAEVAAPGAAPAVPAVPAARARPSPLARPERTSRGGDVRCDRLPQRHQVRARHHRQPSRARLPGSRQPVPCKCEWRDSVHPIELAPFLPFDPNPFSGQPRQPQGEPQDGEISLNTISRWLFAAYGITGVIPNQPRPTYLRAAPSAGGLYPAEAYVVVSDCPLPGRPGSTATIRGASLLVPLWDGPTCRKHLVQACYRQRRHRGRADRAGHHRGVRGAAVGATASAPTAASCSTAATCSATPA